jgi:hypothetical protein
MADIPRNTTISSDGDLFREEAERARRHAAAATDRQIIEQLNLIASLYDKLAAGQNPSPVERD